MNRLALAVVVLVALPSLAQEARWIAPSSGPKAATDLASWIWTADEAAPAPTTANAPVGRAYLAREFDSPAEAEATLAFACDNAATIHLNGERVLLVEDWRAPARARVRVRKGRNLIAVEGENTPGTSANPAGLIGLVRVDSPGAATIATDPSWLGSPVAWAGFPGAAPAGCAPAVVVGPMGTPPWSLASSSFEASDPCPIVRRTFALPAKPVRAVARVVGLGHYQLRVNGVAIGDSFADQAWSQYDRRIYEREFDLAPHLDAGENVIGLAMGNSFWRVGPVNDPGRFSKTDATPDFSNGEAFLVRFDATVEFDGGSSGPKNLRLVSDKDWRWKPGPVTFSHIYAGEDFDATLEPVGWDRTGFDARSWARAREVEAPPGERTLIDAPPLRVHEVFEPLEIRVPRAGAFTYVFPQNCSGVVEAEVSGPRGSRVRLKPCEFMDESGSVRFTYTWGTGKDIWCDYTLSGGGRETHRSLFFYTGARYVEVTGAVPEGAPNPEGLPVVHALRLAHVRQAAPAAGEFRCSSGLQERAHELIDWSIRSNMSHVLTDCPHREKNGWQEQNWHMARALCYRYDLRDTLRKIARDIRDTQLPDGHVPTNCPNYLVGVGPHGFWNEAPEWGVASVLVPWHLYEWYDDRATLVDAFDSMARYTDYLSSIAREGVAASNLGDWYDFGHGQGDGPSRWTPSEVSATAIWALAAETTARAAEALARTDDAAKYRALRAAIGRTFVERFWNPETGQVENRGSCQAGNAVALAAGLIPEVDRGRAIDAIVADLVARGYQQTTGEVLHVFLVRVLGEAGRGDVLHRVYAREAPGSYGHMVNLGLTSLPESWDARAGTGNSMNHFMLGHLVEWHFAFVAGIRQAPGSRGWRDIVIAPQVGPLTSAGASFDSPAGRVGVEWSVARGEFSIEVLVPEGVRARVVLPDSTEHAAPAGRTRLRCAMPPG